MALGLDKLVGGLIPASLIASEEARSDQRKAMRLQQKLQERKLARERLSQLRQGMIQRAQIIASGAAGSAIEGSAVQGGAGSVQSQSASNVAFINQVQGFNEAINAANISASRHAAEAETFASAARIGSMFL